MRKILIPRTVAQLQRRLKYLGACNAIEYKGMTLRRAWNKETSTNRLIWWLARGVQTRQNVYVLLNRARIAAAQRLGLTAYTVPEFAVAADFKKLINFAGKAPRLVAGKRKRRASR